MKVDSGGWAVEPSELAGVLAALSNPQRLRILASLAEGRNYVSQIARDIQLERPLVHMHLQRLEAARLVTGRLELSVDGKALKYYELQQFQIVITPEAVVAATAALDPET